MTARAAADKADRGQWPVRSQSGAASACLCAKPRQCAPRPCESIEPPRQVTACPNPATAGVVQTGIGQKNLARYPDWQQAWCCCTGGQGTSPYEQNTQQSPGKGRSIAWQFAHSKKNWHASTGMCVVCSNLHSGQVNFDSYTIEPWPVANVFMSEPAIGGDALLHKHQRLIEPP